MDAFQVIYIINWQKNALKILKYIAGHVIFVIILHICDMEALSRNYKDEHYSGKGF